MEDKIEKILFTCFLVTIPFPLIFTQKVPDSSYEIPTFKLFIIPIVFLILFIIYQVWKPKKT